MTKELGKRPFVRPLFIWVIGICWAVYWPGSWMMCGVLCLLLLLLVIGGGRGANDYPLYTNRHSWGMAFGVLFLLLAIAYTSFRLRYPPSADIPVWQVYCEAWQFELLQTIDRLDLSDSDKSVLATLTLGYRQQMDWTVRQRFTLSGAAHILSVSGFHVAVVYVFVRHCLFFLSEKSRIRYLKYGILLVAIWLFSGMTGLAAPAIRSALMLSFYLLGRLLRRRTDSYNTWAATAFCMLVYNPFYLFDIGFELSFIAVLSILFFYKRIRTWFVLRNPWIQTLWDWFAISLAAQIYTLPLCFYYFGSVSSVALLTALPVTFLSTLLIPAALLWMLLSAMGWNWEMLASNVELLTSSFCLFIDRLGRIPAIAAYVPFTPLMLGLLYASLFFFTLYIKGRKARWLLFTLLFLLFFLGAAVFETLIQ